MVLIVLDLSPDQAKAIDAFRTWYENPSRAGRPFVLTGLAGTGKSSITAAMIEELLEDDVRVAIAAPTGKAASVLRRKGLRDSRTVHSLIYKPQPWCLNCEKPRTEEEDSPEIVGDAVAEAARLRAIESRRLAFCCCSKEEARASCRFHRAPMLEHSIVVIDEASMVSGDMLEDLQSFDVRLVFVGDHGQLPPIGDDPLILADPCATLERIHRQGEGSGIVLFAHRLRSGSVPQLASEEVFVTAERRALHSTEHDIVICGRNRTRCAINAVQRRLRGFEGGLSVGESVICLRNDRDLGIYNGQIFTVESVESEQMRLWGETVDVGVFDLIDDCGVKFGGIRFLPEQFGQEKTLSNAPRRVALFDFAYCITAHKSQGSEWDRVLVIDESACFRDQATRWRYTAATRAAKRLTWYRGQS